MRRLPALWGATWLTLLHTEASLDPEGSLAVPFVSDGAGTLRRRRLVRSHSITEHEPSTGFAAIDAHGHVAVEQQAPTERAEDDHIPAEALLEEYTYVVGGPGGGPGPEKAAAPANASVPDVPAALEEEKMHAADRSSITLPCAKEGGKCVCDGVVTYGNKIGWKEERVGSSIICSADVFGGGPKITNATCACFALDWCIGKDKEQPDPPNRRRITTGRKGTGLYQRRRWCGWGPIDCEWGQWSGWGSCSTSCGLGRQTAARQQQVGNARGGKCIGESIRQQTCKLADCADGSGGDTPEPDTATSADAGGDASGGGRYSGRYSSRSSSSSTSSGDSSRGTPKSDTPAGAASSGATSSGSTPAGATSSGATPSVSTPMGAASSGATSSGSTSSGATSSGATSSNGTVSSAGGSNANNSVSATGRSGLRRGLPNFFSPAFWRQVYSWMRSNATEAKADGQKNHAKTHHRHHSEKRHQKKHHSKRNHDNNHHEGKHHTKEQHHTKKQHDTKNQHHTKKQNLKEEYDDDEEDN